MILGQPFGTQPPSLLKSYGDQLSRIIDRGQAELALLQQAELQNLDLLMRNIVQQSFDGIMSFNANCQACTANEAAHRIFGYERQSLLGVDLDTLLPSLDSYRRIRSSDSRCGERLEGVARRQSGEFFPVEVSMRTTQIGKEPRLIVIMRDITDAKTQERKLQHLAWHDSLTGLPNRLLLKDRMRQALRIAERERKPLALLLLDLNRFKEVNDTLGHQVGDMLLVDLAKRLNTCVRKSDTIARLGGDEFAILLPAESSEGRAREVSERIVAVVKQPFEVIDGLKLEVGVSIGIAAFPKHATNETRLMQCADVAMYAAKRGAGPVEIYDRHTDHNTVRLLTLSGGLRQAIEGDQLSFAYQPKLDMAGDMIASVEALARWTHPVQGPIPPDEFITQAEHTGMIQPFTRWSFNAAFRQLAAWQQDGRQISLAVNLSSRSLHDEQLPTIVRDLLDSWRIDPALITLELTESAVMLDPAGALVNVRRLHDLGLRISVDDFGTGYSSLSHLQRLPLDELKIDKSFVVNMTNNEQDLVIVRSTIDLAHNMGLKVVAEGVESADHLDLLRDLGCDFAQGYYLSAPLTLEQMNGWFERSPWPIASLDSASLKPARRAVRSLEEVAGAS